MKKLPKTVYKIRSKHTGLYLSSKYLVSSSKWDNTGTLFTRFADVVGLLPRRVYPDSFGLPQLNEINKIDFNDLEIIEIEVVQTENKRISFADVAEYIRREEVFKKRYGYSALNMLRKIKKEGLREFRYMFILTRSQEMNEVHSRLKELGLNRTKYRFHSSIIAFKDKYDATLARLALADETELFDYETFETL
jgi:hypothetical protein